LKKRHDCMTLTHKFMMSQWWYKSTKVLIWSSDPFYTGLNFMSWIDLFEFFIVWYFINFSEYSQTCLMWPSKGTVKYGHIRQVVA
jgi:hypothetical protein